MPDFSHFTKSDLYGRMSDSEILMAGSWNEKDDMFENVSKGVGNGGGA